MVHSSFVNSAVSTAATLTSSSSSSSLASASPSLPKEAQLPLLLGWGLEKIYLSGNQLGSSAKVLWDMARENRRRSWVHRQRKRAIVFMASCRANNDKHMKPLSLSVRPLLSIIMDLVGDHPTNAAVPFRCAETAANNDADDVEQQHSASNVEYFAHHNRRAFAPCVVSPSLLFGETCNPYTDFRYPSDVDLAPLLSTKWANCIVTTSGYRDAATSVVTKATAGDSSHTAIAVTSHHSVSRHNNIRTRSCVVS